jgi:hypothetical protein
MNIKKPILVNGCFEKRSTYCISLFFYKCDGFVIGFSFLASTIVDVRLVF